MNESIQPPAAEAPQPVLLNPEGDKPSHALALETEGEFVTDRKAYAREHDGSILDAIADYVIAKFRQATNPSNANARKLSAARKHALDVLTGD